MSKLYFLVEADLLLKKHLSFNLPFRRAQQDGQDQTGRFQEAHAPSWDVVVSSKRLPFIGICSFSYVHVTLTFLSFDVGIADGRPSRLARRPTTVLFAP
jgi:hypothetical protein